jgi:pyridinium-3,5-bisthiocarboxylic acid mononucleotide nickel chelatase
MTLRKDRPAVKRQASPYGIPGGARRVLYLDCFSGISGDMFLGLSVDLGVPLATLKRRLSRLRLKGYSLASHRVQRSGLWGTQVEVRIPRPRGAAGKGHHHAGFHAHPGPHASHAHEHSGHEPHRGLREIRKIVLGAGLPEATTSRALRVFQTLVEAEARVHRVPLQQVHLHEVGALDAIVDIVGACICLEELGVDRVIASPLPTGSGIIHCEHGIFPVPAPATVEILKGKPLYGGSFEGELVTPTGAALVATFADEFGPVPPLRVDQVGYGAGRRDPADHPNLLRGLLGSLDEPAALLERVTVIQTTIDDLNPQVYGYLMERLFATGALEVFFTAIQMKKNRPGTLVTVIVPEARFEDVGAAIFRETTTIGFRYQRMDRVELGREIRRVRTPYGPVRIKVSLFQGKVVQATPEYEDCRAAAQKSGVALREIQRLASQEFHRP